MLRLFKKKKIDVEALIASSVESLRLVTESHRSGWRLGQEQSWSVDEQAGKIVFAFADGVVAAAPAQVIGTLHTDDNTFMWGWDHPSVMPNLRQHAERVRVFGTRNGSAELTTQTVSCTEKRAWEYTALAMLLAEANGAYRAQVTPSMLVFMTFGEVTFGGRG